MQQPGLWPIPPLRPPAAGRRRDRTPVESVAPSDKEVTESHPSRASRHEVTGTKAASRLSDNSCVRPYSTSVPVAGSGSPTRRRLGPRRRPLMKRGGHLGGRRERDHGGAVWVAQGSPYPRGLADLRMLPGHARPRRGTVAHGCLAPLAIRETTRQLCTLGRVRAVSGLATRMITRPSPFPTPSP